MADPIGIEIRNLYKIFGPYPAKHVEAVRAGMTKAELQARHHHVLGLRDINISIAPGSIQVIMGLSGSGKSTLIRHINRLIEPTAGEIIIEGQNVVEMSPEALREFRRHRTAMVFQKFALLPHRTVLDNAAYGLEVQGLSEAERYRTAMRWIERVGLLGYEKSYPSQLSGGMQQRVGLARALVNDAPILLMDEAYSALDPLIRYDMQTVLLDLQNEVKKTIVFITHDLDEALRIGDRIALLRDGDVIQQGSAQDIVLRPADDYVANFVQHVDRGRVLKVGTIMATASASLPVPDVAIDPEASIAEALKRMAEGKVQALRVENEGGEVIGHLPFQTAINAYTGRSEIAAE
ncbi:glycine betaine/L-proline ABC transporter ATP-binding protein [Paracoccus methylovorus]|uniref:Quaternary amine transport ATP-binding protein n=1 Tax=Paracoccus methylovorus TaxID=2812658 RepID=A0ABX7JIM4_9RHOB|nr:MULTISPECIES: glycine betaine/L-proline ABC transporter ATP-binding protein [Paracoccus]QRZ12462.1 glycine betaine/L-proline ABC transporter ATP-binding protein [Paracoccus methylovorus]